MAFQDHCASLSTLLDDLSLFAESSTFDPWPVLREPNAERRRAARDQILSASSEYESQLEEIERVRVHVTGIRDKVLSKVWRAKNSLSPIAALPPEILESVFDWVVNPPWDKRTSIKYRDLVMQVSKKWRDTALRSTALWNFGIVVDGDFRSARKSFARAANRPIHLVLSVPHKRTTPISSADALGKYSDSLWISRIAHLELSGHKRGALRALRDLLNAAVDRKLPMLRGCTAAAITTTDALCRTCRVQGVQGVPELDVKATWAPALTILCVRDIPTTLDVSSWSSITSLTLSHQTCPWATLYGGLRHSSHLEEIQLDGLRLSDEEPIVDSEKIHLPRLHTMVLGVDTTEALSHLLRTTHAPRLRKLLILNLPSCTLNDIDASQWPSIVLYFTRLVSPLDQMQF